MKHLILTLFAAGVFLLSACSGSIEADIKKDVLPLQGTWKLYSANLIDKQIISKNNLMLKFWDRKCMIKYLSP